MSLFDPEAPADEYVPGWCPHCGAPEDLCGGTCGFPDDYADDEPNDRCTNPDGHKWEYTGTAYGGDDPRWHGEGRCLCVYCGADGDA